MRFRKRSSARHRRRETRRRRRAHTRGEDGPRWRRPRLAVGHGVFMAHPVPIKAPSVMAADVHPLPFPELQIGVGIAHLAARAHPDRRRGAHDPARGGASRRRRAGCRPACARSAVSTIGLSMAIVVSCAKRGGALAPRVLPVFQEQIKEHVIDGTVYLAPVPRGDRRRDGRPRLRAATSFSAAARRRTATAAVAAGRAADAGGGRRRGREQHGDGGKHVQGGNLARRVLARAPASPPRLAADSSRRYNTA